MVGNTEAFLAELLTSQHRGVEAIVAAQHAVDVAIKVYGEDNHYVVEALNALAGAQLTAGRYGNAIDSLHRSIAIGEGIHDEHRYVPEAWQMLAATFCRMGRFAEARQTAEHTLAHALAHLLTEADRADTDWTLAKASWELGDRPRALAFAAAAEKLYRNSPPGERGDGFEEVTAWRRQHDPRGAAKPVTAK
jgi:tetratricopeptide (TPR) repeat protein